MDGRVLALLLTIGCGVERTPVDVRQLSGGLHPFDELAGVRLGMPARELERVRSRTRFEESEAYEELEGGRVSYGFSGSWWPFSSPDSATLVTVSAMQEVPNDSTLRTLWSETVLDATRRMGAPTSCHALSHRTVRGQRALWVRDSAEISIRAFAPLVESAVPGVAQRTVTAEIRAPQPWNDMVEAWLAHFFFGSENRITYASQACPSAKR